MKNSGRKDRRLSRQAVLRGMKAYTPFQQAVWLACMSIPEGRTRSYKWVAERIGRPKAFRAVGSALGKNPFAPIVPCHRVIAADGTSGGFSAPGGVKVKLKMLRKEGALNKRMRGRVIPNSAVGDGYHLTIRRAEKSCGIPRSAGRRTSAMRASSERVYAARSAP